MLTVTVTAPHQALPADQQPASVLDPLGICLLAQLPWKGFLFHVYYINPTNFIKGLFLLFLFTLSVSLLLK